MISFSVIICTYNPVAEIFTQCLKAITDASHKKQPQEILIIDNNSSVPIVDEPYFKPFLQANTNTRVIVETNQGLTNARLRGIRESKSQLLIFIDDDNFIAEDFFAAAVRIATDHPYIGAFSGQVLLKFEKEPEAWTGRYWGLLVYRKFSDDYWSNLPFNNDTMPCGAGMCITRETAEHYVHLHDTGKRNFFLDRSKGSLLSGGDNDLAMCACDIGKGKGLFHELKLDHYIPTGRTTLDYLTRLAYGIYYSTAVLQYMRTGNIDIEDFKSRIKHLLRKTLMKKNDRIIQEACRKGLRDARLMLKSNYK